MMIICLNWFAMGASMAHAVVIRAMQIWHMSGKFKKFITIMTKQYEFKLQPFESVGFVTLMTHEQK